MLELFNRILQDSHRLPKTAASKGLVKFITYSTYQFFKAAKQYPLLFVEALIPNMKSERSMWKIPNEAGIREKERYLADVNYIPPPSSTTNDTPASREQSPEADNNNIIDDEMADYLFSAFDRRNGEKEDNEANKENINREEEEEVAVSPTLPPLKPTTTTTTITNHSLDTEDYDDGLEEYQSFFGENKENNENNTAASSISKENDFPSGSYGDEGSTLTLETAEVDKLLLDMGIGPKV